MLRELYLTCANTEYIAYAARELFVQGHRREAFRATVLKYLINLLVRNFRTTFLVASG